MKLFKVASTVAIVALLSGVNVAANAVGTIDAVSKATDAQLKSFNTDPSSLLTSNPIGGPSLSSAVKALALADKDSVAKLLDLLKSANPQQASSIVSGLGAAIKALRDSSSEEDRKTAEIIVAQVASALDKPMLEAFNNAANGTQTFAVNSPGFAGPVVGGNVGGPINTLASNPSTINAPSPQSSSTPNPVENFSFSGASLSCSSSVSPARSC